MTTQPSNIIKPPEAESRDGFSLRPVPGRLLGTKERSYLKTTLRSSSPSTQSATKRTQPPYHTTFPPYRCACAPPTTVPPPPPLPTMRMRPTIFGFPLLTAPALSGGTCAVAAGRSPLPPKLREASGRLRPAPSAASLPPPGFRLPHPVSPCCRCSPQHRGTPPCPCCATTGAAASASTPRPTRRVRTGQGVRHGSPCTSASGAGGAVRGPEGAGVPAAGSDGAGPGGTPSVLQAAACWAPGALFLCVLQHGAVAGLRQPDSEGRWSSGWAFRAEPPAWLASECPSWPLGLERTLKPNRFYCLVVRWLPPNRSDCPAWPGHPRGSTGCKRGGSEFSTSFALIWFAKINF